MAGGITFGAAKAILATVVDNGIDPDDPRVKARTDEAQQIILNVMIPVNAMQTVDVAATGTTLLLPKEMEAAYEVEVLGGATVNNQTDVTQGWAMVNQFTYIDPSVAHDNPLVDQYLQPDPGDNTILRRQYDYPGLQAGATVRVTGPKRWLPIENDSTYLIVQNVPALKLMIQWVWAAENSGQNQEALWKSCFDILQGEVKKHNLDPINMMRRKANWDHDLVAFPYQTFGYTRARLAFEIPQAMALGKSELTRILEQAEMWIMDNITAIGMMQEYTAQVIGGVILAPIEVGQIIAVSWRGQPLDIHTFYFRYFQQGHRNWNQWPCVPQLRDEGEIRDVNGNLRRQYKLRGTLEKNLSATQTPHELRFLAILRYMKKAPTDYMVVKNFEAIRMVCQSILHQKEEKYDQAMADKQMAIEELEKELSKSFKGEIIVPKTNFGFFSSRRHHWHHGRM